MPIFESSLFFRIILLMWIWIYFSKLTDTMSVETNESRGTRLTHFSQVSHFYTPWKRQKTKGFLKFSGGIEMWHLTKMDQRKRNEVLSIIPYFQVWCSWLQLYLNDSFSKWNYWCKEISKFTKTKFWKM